MELSAGAGGGEGIELQRKQNGGEILVNAILSCIEQVYELHSYIFLSYRGCPQNVFRHLRSNYST